VEEKGERGSEDRDLNVESLLCGVRTALKRGRRSGIGNGNGQGPYIKNLRLNDDCGSCDIYFISTLPSDPDPRLYYILPPSPLLPFYSTTPALVQRSQFCVV
jgi:hypothetical protein